MNNPVVSVVLPVYDNRNTIQQAVESILNQTFQSLELIIIADGSPPAVMNYLNSISSDKKVRIIRIRRSGIGRALNIGIRSATGRLIARMDADDISFAERIEKQVEFMELNPHIGVLGTVVTYSGPTDSGFARFIKWQNKLISPQELFNARFQDAVICHPTAMFRKELFYRFGGYSEIQDLPEDFELWLRLMHHGIRFTKLDETLLQWNDHPERLTRTHSAYEELNFWRVKVHYLKKHIQGLNRQQNLFVIGRGTQVNRKIRMMEMSGLQVAGKIDIKPHNGNPDFYGYSDILKLQNPFFLSLVKNPAGKKEIDHYLRDHGLRCNLDYLLLE